MAWWQAVGSSSGKPTPAALGQLALGSDSGVIAVWDLAVGQISHELRGHTQAIHDLQYEQNGKTLQYADACTVCLCEFRCLRVRGFQTKRQE